MKRLQAIPPSAPQQMRTEFLLEATQINTDGDASRRPGGAHKALDDSGSGGDGVGAQCVALLLTEVRAPDFLVVCLDRLSIARTHGHWS